VAVRLVHNEAFVTQLKVENSDVTYSLEANYWASPAARDRLGSGLAQQTITREVDGRELTRDTNSQLSARRGGRAAR